DPVDRPFEISANLRVFVFVLDHRAALAHTGANAFFVDRAPSAEQILSRLAAVTKRELARFFVAGIEMLMKPAARWTEHAAFAPPDLDHLVGMTRLVRANPRFRRPHERGALRP